MTSQSSKPSTVHLDTEVRRHQIIREARKIVTSQGMASFTIQELANEVGVSEGAIYRHFKSKEEILLVLVQDVERSLLEAISASARPHKGVLSQLKHLLQRHFSASERRLGISFVVIAEAMRFADPQVKEATRQMVKRYLDFIHSILKSGVDTGEIDKSLDPKAAALMFYGMIQATVTHWSVNGRAQPLAQHTESLWSMFKSGLTTRGNSAHR